MDDEARTFAFDEAGYLNWLSAHPGGWVLNVPRRRGGVALRHRGACRTIQGTGQIWTGSHYYKVVAESADGLATWLALNWPGRVRWCRVCCGSSEEEKALGSQNPQRPRLSGRSRLDVPTGDATTHEVPTRPVVKPGLVTSPWLLWSMGTPVAVLEGLEPKVASWDRRGHPNQQRLSAFLEPVCASLAPLLANGSEWAINMTIDLGRPGRLYRGNDVENYITPLVQALGWRRFVYVAARKQVGGGSRIEIAPARREGGAPAWSGWSGNLGVGIASSEGKRAMRESLRQSVRAPLAPGPVRVQLAWRLPSSRNWVSLWKPTGDAMGPVLGEPRFPQHEFHPEDDRIAELTLHRVVDEGLDSIDVGMWWAPGAE